MNEYLAGAGTEAPDMEEENMTSRPSVGYEDMWAKTLLQNYEVEVDESSRHNPENSLFKL